MNHPLTLIVWTALFLIWAAVLVPTVAFLWNWWQEQRAYAAHCRDILTERELE